MIMKMPKFWEDKDSIRSILLYPFSLLYSLASRYRMNRTKPYKASIPVICIGNIMVGGSGKTPLCLHLAERLKKEGKKPFFLTRGYKSERDNFKVRAYRHSAEEAGDEALLLARTAPTIISRDRALGAKMAEADNADVIIMDDGYQNPGLYKDFCIVSFDGPMGLGNGKILPAGPLREQLQIGLSRANAVIIHGQDKHKLKAEINALFPDMPVFKAETSVPPPSAQKLKGKPVIAFAGIGRPSKFYDTLRSIGMDIRETKDFPDHYFYTKRDLDFLIKRAKTLETALITTAKDHARLSKKWREKVLSLDICLTIEQEGKLLELLHKVLN